jgi:predicted DNA-binding transcriptional regulator YafY
MRKADRLFDIIQTLRTARGPLTAAALAEALEVTPRTVYRDVAALQASRIPVEGAAGLGYVLRRGFDLPPLMFNPDEIEAMRVGMRLVARTGDPALRQAAESVLSKVETVLPETARADFAASSFYMSPIGAPEPDGISLADIRSAVRASRKLRIAYQDKIGVTTSRTVCPVAIEYYVEATLLCGWCELRGDYRHFRTDRIINAERLEEDFADRADALLAGWQALARP